MVVKAIEMVRKIRDKHYEETKALSVKEQIKFIKQKAEKLQKMLKTTEHLTINNKVHM